MDLQPYLKTPEQITIACRVLSYQPFTITDDIQTGVAYSWLYEPEGGRRKFAQSEFVFDKVTCPSDVWERANDAKARLEFVRLHLGGFDLGVLVDLGLDGLNRIALKQDRVFAYTQPLDFKRARRLGKPIHAVIAD
jgi:hypothetical protein